MMLGFGVGFAGNFVMALSIFMEMVWLGLRTGHAYITPPLTILIIIMDMMITQMK